MAYKLREGQGSLFKNDKKGNDKAPDYTGNIMVGGVKKRLTAWIKQGNSVDFFSVQVSDFQQQQTQNYDRNEINSAVGETDWHSDVPF